MGVTSETAEVKLNGRNVEHYKSLGYEIPMRKATKRTREVEHKEYVYDINKPINIKIEHLPKWSHACVKVLCDLCKKNKMTVAYRDYNKVVDKTGSYVCKDCSREKQQNSVKNKYGVYSTMQLKEVRAKANETLCKNGNQKTSKQQLYLHGLYGGEINYPISYYAADICLSEEKVVIEYSGGGHDLRVKLGRLTQEEFNKKEMIRSIAIKKEGYKQMTIISRKDFLPSDQVLLDMLSKARNYFSTTSHSWITYDIDNSIMINAENKDTNGVFFDYGMLRKIKESA